MVANSLIYHPAVTHYNNFVATTVGRDKFLRTVQYFSRFLSYYTLRQNYAQATVDQFNKLKSVLGLVRKAMRLGKFVEHLRAASLASESRTLDPVTKSLAVGRQLGYAGYLFADMLTFLDAAGVRKSEAAKKLQQQAYRAWAFGLTCSVLSGVYSLYNLRLRAAKKANEAEKKVDSKKAVRDRNALQLQLVSDLCDLTVPGSGLGYVDLDDGVVGLAGTVSSLIGLKSQWAKTAPPKP